MNRKLMATKCAAVVTAIMACCPGCGTSRQHQAPPALPPAVATVRLPPAVPQQFASSHVQLTSHRQEEESAEPLPAPERSDAEAVSPAKANAESLLELEASAMANNPTLRRRQQEAAALWARTGYVSKLPDPTVSSMFFIPPMAFEPDRQIAEVQVAQMIPWLGRLKAEARRAYLEALAAENEYQAERVRVVGDIRANWFRLYVLRKQIETTEADKKQLESLINTANARIQTGAAQPGDVLMATLELSSQQEQLLTYRQQVIGTVAELNRLAGRDASLLISPPEKIEAKLPSWNHEMLREVALRSQPELTAARLNTAARRWGIEVARLKRRPDLTFGIGWVIMDAPGAVEPDAGRDSLTLGVTASIPIWHRKYDAMVLEAAREHSAANASEDEIALRLDALLRDLWEQARASQQTVELYEKSILPQARQTFEADQKSLINNTVTFDRVIRDYRTLLTLELGYHKALGQLATTLARIRQAVGVDLLATPRPPQPAADPTNTNGS